MDKQQIFPSMLKGPVSARLRRISQPSRLLVSWILASCLGGCCVADKLNEAITMGSWPQKNEREILRDLVDDSDVIAIVKINRVVEAGQDEETHVPTLEGDCSPERILKGELARNSRVRILPFGVYATDVSPGRYLVYLKRRDGQLYNHFLPGFHPIKDNKVELYQNGPLQSVDDAVATLRRLLE